MGYRSNIKLAFYTDNKCATPFAAVKLWFNENFPKHDFGDVEVGNNHILVSYEDVKWYQGYEEVEAVDRAIALFCETFNANEDTGFHYEMIRVGEELTDIEHDHSGWCQFLMNVSRSIHFD